MNVAEIMKKRMAFSFEVFPPKAEKPVEPLLNTLEHLYQLKPGFISCTYVMPVLSKDPTIRMAVSNGSGIPWDLAEIIGRYGDNPEDFKKSGQEYTINQMHRFINAGIDGLHIYSLNKYEDVTKILVDSGIRKLCE